MPTGVSPKCFGFFAAEIHPLNIGEIAGMPQNIAFEFCNFLADYAVEFCRLATINSYKYYFFVSLLVSFLRRAKCKMDIAIPLAF